MKNIINIILVLSVIAFGSCSSASKLSTVISSNETSATTVGTNCGTALSKLYSQYKESGKINLNNSSTLLSLTELGTYYTELKNNKSNASYISSFGKGLMNGSNGLITNTNVTSTINSLASLTGLSTLTTNASSASTTTISQLTSLLSSFSK
ncbi:MAG: hypothetical protein PHH37_12415 [Paludibacter sp.]|nr:hypothetical protein [Paludibacter sp.]